MKRHPWAPLTTTDALPVVSTMVSDCAALCSLSAISGKAPSNTISQHLYLASCEHDDDCAALCSSRALDEKAKETDRSKTDSPKFSSGDQRESNHSFEVSVHKQLALQPRAQGWCSLAHKAGNAQSLQRAGTAACAQKAGTAAWRT